MGTLEPAVSPGKPAPKYQTQAPAQQMVLYDRVTGRMAGRETVHGSVPLRERERSPQARADGENDRVAAYPRPPVRAPCVRSPAPSQGTCHQPAPRPQPHTRAGSPAHARRRGFPHGVAPTRAPRPPWRSQPVPQTRTRTAQSGYTDAAVAGLVCDVGGAGGSSRNIVQCHSSAPARRVLATSQTRDRWRTGLRRCRPSRGRCRFQAFSRRPPTPGRTGHVRSR